MFTFSNIFPPSDCDILNGHKNLTHQHCVRQLYSIVGYKIPQFIVYSHIWLCTGLDCGLWAQGSLLSKLEGIIMVFQVKTSKNLTRKEDSSTILLSFSVQKRQQRWHGSNSRRNGLPGPTHIHSDESRQGLESSVPSKLYCWILKFEAQRFLINKCWTQPMLVCALDSLDFPTLSSSLYLYVQLHSTKLALCQL